VIPRIRVHDQLGVLLRFPGEGDWLWVCRGREQSQRMSDRWSQGPGWREVDVREQVGP
jgi:hypothetical protein